MNAIGYAALGTGFTFAMTAVGSAVVFFVKRPGSGGSKRVCLGFAAGVMIASTIWSLIMPAVDYASGGALPAWLPVTGGMALGTLFLLVLEVLIERLRGVSRMPRPLRAVSRSTALLTAAVTLHNIP